MSASWNRKPVVMPHIPPETWQHILQWAILVPGSLDPNAEDPFDCSEPRHWRNRLTSHGICEEQDRIRRSLVTKRYIIRVCKQWYALGIPLLYESIFVGRQRYLELLLDTLRRSPGHASPDSGSLQLGWWTRRLDFRMRDIPPEGSLGKASEDTIVEIFALLPRLSIFVSGSAHSAQSCFKMTLDMSLHLANACSQTLQMISWNNAQAKNWVRYHPELTSMVLERLLALRTLHTDFTFMNDVTQVAANTSPQLNFLTTSFPLDFLLADNQVAPAFLALRQLYIQADFGDGWYPSRSPFLIAHGASLTALYLHYSEGDNIRGSFLPLMSSQYCPRLVHLVLVCPNWMVLHDLRIPRQITHLGLLCTKAQAMNVVYDDLFRTLVTVMSPPTPLLRVIRFLDPRGAVDLRNHHRKALRRGLSRLASYDLRVEDHEGNDMRGLLD